MTAKVKKGIFVSISICTLLLVVLMILPFAFKSKIVQLAKQQINAQLNATVDFDDLNISFLRSFPDASLRFENFRIIGLNEFKKDTLLYSEEMDLVMNVKSLFADTGYEIEKLRLNNTKVLAHVLVNGAANWDVMKQDSTQAVDTSKMSFHLKLKKFVIENASVTYWDEESNMKAVIQELNHSTTGDLTADSSLLVTKTTIESLSFFMDNIAYLSKANVAMDATINANLNQFIFSFSDNSSRINAIPFSFKGWFKMLDDGYDMDLTLDANKVDFKAILSMVPAIYAKSFDGLKAGGKVNMAGFIKGKMVGDYFPAFQFKLLAKDGWFQYPDLPMALKNIAIKCDISNPGKTLDETVIDIANFSFLMGNNPFSASMRVAYPMSDPELNMNAVGKLNLGMIKDVYPLEKGMDLNGMMDMNLLLAGRMSYYETNQYDKFKFAGKLNVSNMLLKSSNLPQSVSIARANLLFNNRYADLSNLQMKIGRNDFSASGKLENFVAYALKNKTLIGTLNLQSNYLNVGDFMSQSTDVATTTSNTKADAATSSQALTVIEIPKNIDFVMNADMKQLVYDKMIFSNSKGVLKVKDGNLLFQNVSTQAFGGAVLMNGIYSSADINKPAVDFDLKLNEVVFGEVFKQVEMIQKLAPIFEKANGKFSTSLKFNSLLQKDMMPNLSSLMGTGAFSTKSVGITNVPAFTALMAGLKRNDLNATTLKDIALMFDIKDGKVNTKPFDMKVADVKLNLGGSTGLDKSIAYKGRVDLPSKFNLGQLSTVNFTIGGTFSKPKVQLDMVSAINSLVTDTKGKVINEATKQVDVAKEKALDEARKQKEAALKTAQAEADKLRNNAKVMGDRLIAEAQAQGDQLVAKATNPVTKKLAQLSAQKLIDEAKKKAVDLNAKAEIEASKLIQKADVNF